MAISESFDGVASMLTHGGAAQDFVIQLALPYASEYYKTAVTIIEPLAMTGLIAAFIMWVIFPVGQVKNFAVGLIIAVLLLAPGEYRTGDSALWFSSSTPSSAEDITGLPETTATYPKSVIIFLNIVGTLERVLYKTTNNAINKLDDGQSDGVLSSRIRRLVDDSTVMATASPELISLHRLYRSSCEPRAAAKGLTTAQMQALGFNGGMMMGYRNEDSVEQKVDMDKVSFFRSLFPMSPVTKISGDDLSNSMLRGLSSSASDSGVFLSKGSLIPSKRYFLAREKGVTPSNNAFLSRSEVGGEQRFAHPNPSAAGVDSHRFYASNCDELHDMVQFGNRSYYAFIQQIEMEKGKLVRDQSWYEWGKGLFTSGSRSVTSTEVAKLADPKYFMGMTALTRAISEGNGYQGTGGNNRGPGNNGYVNSAAKALGLKLSEFWKKWNLALAPAAATGVVAMGMGLLFMLMPILIAFSILPGRLSTLGTTIKVVLFIKLTLFLMYITSKLTLVVTSASMFAIQIMDGSSTSLYAGMISLAVTSQLVGLITLLTAAPLLAYFVVFSETRGLSSLSPGSIGKEAIRNTVIAAGATLQGVTRIGGGAASIAKEASPNLEQRGGQIGRGVPRS